MGFSENAKKYFFDELGLTNRKISQKMNNYSEVLVSRYMNSDKISATFIEKIQEFFPEADINRLIATDDKLDGVEDPGRDEYKTSAIESIDAVMEELAKLREVLSRK
jgi:hypothetical protein